MHPVHPGQPIQNYRPEYIPRRRSDHHPTLFSAAHLVRLWPSCRYSNSSPTIPGYIPGQTGIIDSAGTLFLPLFYHSTYSTILDIHSDNQQGIPYQSIPVYTTLCYSRPLPTSLFIPVINIHHPTGQARGIPRSIPPSRSLATATGPGDTLAALGNTSSPLTTRTLPLFHWEYLQPTHSTPLKANPQLSPAHSAAQLHEVTPLPYLPYLPDTQNVQVQALQSKHMQ